MKKPLKIAAFAVAVALLVWLVYLIDAFTGYPFRYFAVKHNLDAYMEETYSGTDFVAEKPRHIWKLSGFQVLVSSPHSPDSHFQLFFDLDGTLVSDSYEEDVAGRGNTALRLQGQYQKLVQAVFDSAVFPYPASCGGSFAPFFNGTLEVLKQPAPSLWDISTLVLDQDYDPAEFSGQYGFLYLDVTAPQADTETAAAALLEVRRIMEKAGLPFRLAELWVHPEDETAQPLHILSFDWDEIYEEGMTERVQTAIEATRAHYQN